MQMRKISLAILFSIVLVLAACGGDTNDTNESNTANEGNVANNEAATEAEPVDRFEAVNQEGEPFTLDDLKGQWWVADFVFTNCTTVCLPMTSNMKILQDGLQEAGLDEVQLVSFSVDPDRDTPEVLKEYGEQYGADFSNWNFLTGYEFDYIKDYSISSFKNLVAPPPEGDDQVTHGTAFFLVNPDGVVVNHYKGTDSAAMDQIIEDLKNSL